LIYCYAEVEAEVIPMIRVLESVFWVAALLLLLLLVLNSLSYDFIVGLVGDRGLRVIGAVLVAVVLICSGVIALYEFRLNPLVDSERGEWTGRQLFYALVSTISLFLAFFYIPAAFF
jgi:uncharacterized membrane protein